MTLILRLPTADFAKFDLAVLAERWPDGRAHASSSFHSYSVFGASGDLAFAVVRHLDGSYARLDRDMRLRAFGHRLADVLPVE
jgi:hypothetical protein